jgi:hypothetical protein
MARSPSTTFWNCTETLFPSRSRFSTPGFVESMPRTFQSYLSAV